MKSIMSSDQIDFLGFPTDQLENDSLALQSYAGINDFATRGSDQPPADTAGHHGGSNYDSPGNFSPADQHQYVNAGVKPLVRKYFVLQCDPRIGGESQCNYPILQC